jgi:cupin fold WbuC family metalloprotein
MNIKLSLNGWLQDEKAKSLSFFPFKYPVTVDVNLINKIKKFTIEQKRDVRLCLHISKKSLAHDMLIFQQKSTYCRPHWHEDKGECFHIVEGILGVIIFNKDGGIEERYLLKEGELLRIMPGSIHGVYAVSEYCIYHESKQGPFNSENDSIYPKWSLETDENNEFRKKLGI